MFQIQKRAARQQPRKDFAVESPFPLVRHVMYGKAGDNRVESANFRQWVVQIVLDDGDASVAAETLPQFVQHRWRKIQRYASRAGPSDLHERKQTPRAAAHIQKPLDALRQKLQQSPFAFAAVGNFIGGIKVVARVICGRPQIYIGRFRHAPAQTPQP
jgi:hypothetical protein